MPATLIRPAEWGLRKPPLGAVVDWGHPLAKDLNVCVLANEGAGYPHDIGARGPVRLSLGAGATASNLIWRNTKYGPALAKIGGLQNDGWVVGTEGTDLRIPTNSITILGNKWHPTGTFPPGSGGYSFACVPATGTSIANINLPYTDGTVYWDFGGTGAPNRVSVAGLTFGDDIWAFTAGFRGSTIWQNGILRASQSTAITRFPTTGQFALFLDVNVSMDTDGRVGFAYMWNRELTASEIAWLTVEPYAFIAPPGPKIRYLDLGPTTATVTGSAAITGSGAVSATGLRVVAGDAAITGSGVISAAGLDPSFGASYLTNHHLDARRTRHL